MERSVSAAMRCSCEEYVNFRFYKGTCYHEKKKKERWTLDPMYPMLDARASGAGSLGPVSSSVKEPLLS